MTYLFLLCILAVAPPTPSFHLESSIMRLSAVGNEGVETVSFVKEEQDGYSYFYVIRNVGKKETWLVSWKILDKAATKRLLLLKPGEKRIFKVLSDKESEEKFGVVRCYKEEDGVWETCMGGGTKGYLPEVK